MSFPFQGLAQPPTPYQLMRMVEDAAETSNAAWDAEHHADGTHKALATLEVTGLSELTGGQYASGANLFTGQYQATLSGTTHDLAQPDGLPIEAPTIRVSASGAWTLTGIVPYDLNAQQRIYLVNASGFDGTLSHNAGSSALYRFSLPRDENFTLSNGRWIELMYDSSSHVWRTEELRPLVIRSVQRGTVSIVNGNTQATGTLGTTLTDTGKAVVAFLGASGGTGGANTGNVSAYLDNLTTTSIRATRDSTADTTVVGYQITEYY